AVAARRRHSFPTRRSSDLADGGTSATPVPASRTGPDREVGSNHRCLLERTDRPLKRTENRSHAPWGGGTSCAASRPGWRRASDRSSVCPSAAAPARALDGFALRRREGNRQHMGPATRCLVIGLATLLAACKTTQGQ